MPMSEPPLSDALAGPPLEQSPSQLQPAPPLTESRRLISQVKQMLGLTGSGHAEAEADDPQLPELLPKLPNLDLDLDLGLELPADLCAPIEFALPLQCTPTTSTKLGTTHPLLASPAGAADPHLLHQDHQNTNKTTNLDDATTAATSASAAAISSTTQPTSAATPSFLVSQGALLLPADDDHPGPGPSSNYRGSSAASAVLDDPFFCRPVGAPNTHPTDTATTPDFHPSLILSQTPSPGPGPVPSPQSESTYSYNRNDPHRPWPPPRKESLRVDSPTPWFDQSRSRRAMASIHIAVIGAYGAGKSSFVQRAFRLQRPPELNISTLRMEIHGTRYLVTLVELDLDGFKDLDPGQSIQWPKQIDGHMFPHMPDGALVLYDVTNTDNINDLSPTMTSLANSSLPTILVATKCDTPASIRQVDMNAVAHSFPSCVAHLRISSDIPGGAREALLTMIDAILANRREAQERPKRSASRRRAASAANLDATPEVNGRPISQHSKHSRASSDFSLLKGFGPPSGDGPHQRSQLSRSPRTEYLHAQYGASNPQSSDIPEDGLPHALSGTLRTPGTRLEKGSETFLDFEELDLESHRLSDDVASMARNQDYLEDEAPKLAGITFDELIDRIIAPKMARADNNFADIFLCLYRKFATPCELMSALLSRLDRLRDDTDMPSLLSIESQMRVIEVVAKWLSLYPGDFARTATRRRLEGLISDLATNEVFSAAARQMKGNLEQKVVDDDDTWWAKADPVDDEEDEEAGRDVEQKLAESVASVQIDESGGYDPRRPSHSSELSGADPTAKFTYHSIEDYEREAAALVPSPVLPPNKIRYHSFMDIDPDIIADEITRIDWIMFSSIRIRDMVRHVSLSADQKERCRSLKNVNRMVSHFNHIAQWVSNMILIRDKAKHRAPCLERFMVIAQRLRTLNNYNGLAAVLAGINGTAIHRLAQTRNLVSPEVQKRFARLVLLMGTQKSHFAYRLAWENTPLPRIPFIPLHRRDLVSAEEGSRTFVGPNNDRINWKKYEVLGEVLLPIMRSQGQPYPNLTKHEPSRELILDMKMTTDEEDIYQRSVQVEPSTGGESTTRKKFAWLVNKS
ncbi:ras GEF [Neurospora intermedia]|uniref:Ras GEF n=1 Tax=Neurospora intermedia TaxID=5142 RepID=A0ABR3DDH3_NEUIN